MKRLYLDDAAATRLDPQVERAMRPYLTEQFGNPASLHAEGVAAKQAVEAGRRSIAEGLEAHADEMIFTSGGTEANNLALFGAALPQRDRRHLIISNIEHPSVSEAAAELERRGFIVTRVPVDTRGMIDPLTVKRALRDDTFLVSVIFANNEIGTIQPVAEIGKLCQRAGVLFHTDACQAAPWLPLRVAALHADLLTLNAAKMHGPKGAGALYVRRGVSLKPLLYGGGQEHGLRSGTENVAGIVGFAAAFRISRERMLHSARVAALRDYCISELLRIPGAKLNGHAVRRLPNNVNVSFEGVDGETLVLGLDGLGIAASSGSACSSLHRGPSHVLEAIAGGQTGNVRFTLDWDTKRSGIDRAVKAVATMLDRQRPIGARWSAIVQKGISHAAQS